jgi:hypothetical protein
LVRSADAVAAGDAITTVFPDGKVRSRVEDGSRDSEASSGTATPPPRRSRRRRKADEEPGLFDADAS